MRRMSNLRSTLAPLVLGAAIAVGASASAPGVAHAESLTAISQKATAIAGEAIEIDHTIKRPGEEAAVADEARRHYIEAQVAYGTGNYADASILLFDVVERFPGDHVYNDAVFLLADSLYMRGANLTARKYFRQVVDQFGESDPNYPKSVERLLELSLRLQDQEGVPDLLARLDRIPAGRALASGPYVRAKFQYFTGDYAGAAAAFGNIPESNEFYFQARYFLAAAQIAQDDLAGAVKTLYDLLKVQPKDKKQQRVVELTHMALGRLHYTRDQPTEAIDQYLMVSRHSDLFDDALYEVAFVYVRAKQFDKALRALELLEMATGGSCA
jgi:TolA-binding protein